VAGSAAVAAEGHSPVTVARQSRIPTGFLRIAVGLTAWHNRQLPDWRIPVRRYTDDAQSG